MSQLPPNEELDAKVYHTSAKELDDNSSGERAEQNEPSQTPLAALLPRKAFLAWLLICYSTGPTGAMVNSYIPVVLQSIANRLGHAAGSTAHCSTRGRIECLVQFGGGEIDYNSYVLYLQAIATACQGVFTILICGLADYADYRKSIMLICILIFGALATPYAGLTEVSYSILTTSAVLFALISTVQGAYGALEFSYIPLFMRAETGSLDRPQTGLERYMNRSYEKAGTENRRLHKGAKVAVLGLVMGNLGSLTALLIGIVITYSKNITVATSYHSFLIAITVAGCMTVVLGTIAGFLLPSVSGKVVNSPSIMLPFLNWARLLRNMRRFPEPFKLCAGWILWNTGWGSQLGLMGLLFREVLGLDRSSGIYTTWTFTSVLFSTMGSLTWMFVFPHVRLRIKTWAFCFLTIQFICILWGTFGINKEIPIGFKHAPEFWIEQLLFMSTASALRALNRVLYSSLIPKGSEAIFFGMQIVVDLATGWISPLVSASIQNRTHELRFPMIPNALLVLAGAGFYWWVNVEKGIKDAEQPLED